MLTDVKSLYHISMMRRGVVNSRYARYKLDINSDGNIRIEFINPYYNAYVDTFIKSKISCVVEDILRDVMLWQERKS